MNKRCVIWCAVSSEEQAKDDKLSLVTQENEMRAYAKEQGWDVLQVFMWDGYSRWESDPIAALEDFAEQGRFEYHELRRMWRDRGFDVLLLYTHSRAGRSFTMQSWVVENVIRHGGEIYRIHGGWINKRDYAFQIGIGGVLSTADVDRLIEQRFHAMNQRAEQGLPTSSSPPISHIVRRDEMGKPLMDNHGRPLPMIVDERLRRFWNDAAQLFLEGHAFKSLELELYRRFGHAREDGKPHTVNMVRTAYSQPAFWGHSARFHRDGRKHGFKVGVWVFDETIAPPEGVLLHRFTHDPVYTGDLADRVKAELKRRGFVSHGRSTSYGTGRFTGLLVCGECTYYYGYSRKGKYSYLYCGARNVGIYRSRVCNQKLGITEGEVQQFFHEMLERAIDRNSLSAAFDELVHEATPASNAKLLQNEIEDIQGQIKRLIAKQKTAAKNLSTFYDDELTQLSERLEILTSHKEQSIYAEKRASIEASEERAVLGDIKQRGLEKFWEQPDVAINQMLHRLLGYKRLIVVEGELLKRFVPAPPEKRT